MHGGLHWHSQEHCTVKGHGGGASDSAHLIATRATVVRWCACLRSGHAKRAAGLWARPQTANRDRVPFGPSKAGDPLHAGMSITSPAADSCNQHPTYSRATHSTSVLLMVDLGCAM